MESDSWPVTKWYLHRKRSAIRGNIAMCPSALRTPA
jgi:hypothetical protein